MRNGNVLIDFIKHYKPIPKYLERKVLICKMTSYFLSYFNQYSSCIIYHT